MPLAYVSLSKEAFALFFYSVFLRLPARPARRGDPPTDTDGPYIFTDLHIKTLLASRRFLFAVLLLILTRAYKCLVAPSQPPAIVHRRPNPLSTNIVCAWVHSIILVPKHSRTTINKFTCLRQLADHSRPSYSPGRQEFMSRPLFGPVPPPIPYGRKPPEPPRRPSLADTAEIMSVNAVYYPNYRAYRGETPATLNYKCISHVYYAYAHVNPDGFVFLSDELADGTMEVDGVNGCLGSFMVLKDKFPHLKVLLSIGGVDSSQSFRILSETAARRDNFARSANLLVREARLDGIDIDWQHPDDAQQGSNFLSLLATVRLYLPSEDYMVVVPLPTNSWALQHIDLPKIQEYVDLVNLMAYDFSGPWRPTAGHHAQLYRAQEGENSGSAAVEHILSTGFPAKKILLGIPVYGRSFIGAEAPGDQYHSNGGEDGIFEYKALPRPGTQEVVDAERCAAVCVGGDGGFVTYDNPDTVAMKGRYCKEQGLGGLFYWTGTADITNGPRSLVESGFRALHGS
ncbi:hypothetical protein V496_03788 [Pseudogymnoascus sp. VKM F-4515 (FW-2607)]|nr:hypothetical protein V496_03788 [Pseudogymnoascus sp. VKM F-4515 (FW-2607)]